MALLGLLESVPGRQDPPEVFIEVLGQKLAFARPRVADLSLTPDRAKDIGRAAPGLRPEQIFMCHLLGVGYVPEPGEGTVVGWKVFAQIAAANDLLFSNLCKQWEEGFPEFVDWLGQRVEAKNGSWVALEDSDTAPSTSLPDSGEPYASLGT